MISRLRMLSSAMSAIGWLAAAPLVAEPVENSFQASPFGQQATSRGSTQPDETNAHVPLTATADPHPGLPLLPPPAPGETQRGTRKAAQVSALEELPSPSAPMTPLPYELSKPMACSCHIDGGQCSICQPTRTASGHGRKKPWWRPVHWGQPELFMPTPLGASVRGHFGAHIANGLAAQLVLYHYDFCDPGSPADAATLTTAGRARLMKLIDLLVQTPWPLTIEPSHDPHLDAARQLHVATVLEHLTEGFVLPDRIVVAPPAARGLGGVEAMIHRDNMLQQTMAAGVYVSPDGTTGAPIPMPVVP